MSESVDGNNLALGEPSHADNNINSGELRPSSFSQSEILDDNEGRPEGCHQVYNLGIFFDGKFNPEILTIKYPGENIYSDIDKQLNTDDTQKIKDSIYYCLSRLHAPEGQYIILPEPVYLINTVKDGVCAPIINPANNNFSKMNSALGKIASSAGKIASSAGKGFKDMGSAASSVGNIFHSKSQEDALSKSQEDALSKISINPVFDNENQNINQQRSSLEPNSRASSIRSESNASQSNEQLLDQNAQRANTQANNTQPSISNQIMGNKHSDPPKKSIFNRVFGRTYKQGGTLRKFHKRKSHGTFKKRSHN